MDMISRDHDLTYFHARYTCHWKSRSDISDGCGVGHTITVTQVDDMGTDDDTRNNETVCVHQDVLRVDDLSGRC